MEVMRGFRFKILLVKAYFDKGYGMTNYFFKLIAVFGLTTQLAKTTFYILLIYSILCYFIGYACYKFKIVDTENEINNIFNPFQREVRDKLGIPNN